MLANQVVNLRTGEFENCNVGFGCKRHSHSLSLPASARIQSIAASMRDEEATLAASSHNSKLISRFKNLFSKESINGSNGNSGVPEYSQSRNYQELLKEAARQELLQVAQGIIGMTGHEINELNTFSNTLGDNALNKGHLGNVIQENVFGMPANSTPEPDFAAEGLELKVVGVKKKRNGDWVAKDRMVANIIDFETEDTSGDITASSFWKKNSRTLVVMYESVHRDKLSNKIVGAFILDLNEHEHFEQFASDYKAINDKIRTGKAETISGKDTHFLEACTKGEGHGRDLRSQPNSSVLAKQRAYAFKPRFMSPIINQALKNAEANKSNEVTVVIDENKDFSY